MVTIDNDMVPVSMINIIIVNQSPSAGRKVRVSSLHFWVLLLRISSFFRNISSIARENTRNKNEKQAALSHCCNRSVIMSVLPYRVTQF